MVGRQYPRFAISRIAFLNIEFYPNYSPNITLYGGF